MQGLLMLEELLKQTIAGKKTMTRRDGGLKEVNKDPENYMAMSRAVISSDSPYFYFSDKLDGTLIKAKARFKTGEIVFIKEPYIPYGQHWEKIKYLYLDSEEAKGMKFNNKMFMPLKAARYFLEITNVRVERLHDISDEDCIAEGIEPDFANWKDYLPNKRRFSSYGFPRDSFFSLFNKANGLKVNRPVPNNWVFVYEYKFLKDYKHEKF